jgi:exodeoxyribonuclease V alpha subunit
MNKTIPNNAGHEPPATSLLDSARFNDIDRHFARFLERLSGGAAPELELAAALVSRSRGEGNICLDLRAVATEEFPRGTSPGTVQLPEFESWMAKLRASPVVGSPGEFKPLVLDSSGRLYLHRYWEYESNLARAIRQRAGMDTGSVNTDLLRESLNRFFPSPAGVSEPDWQRAAAETAVRKSLCVISGGPGTGKTRTVAVVLALLLEQAAGSTLRIALAAPTGKAAARLQESIKTLKAVLPCEEAIKARLPEETFTLHRLLGGVPGVARFKYNEGKPLPFDVVVVDEASMVDLALMAKLFEAIPPQARVVLLGDKDQLASVEAGAVLGDICAGARQTSSLPLSKCIVELRSNYRFGEDNGILALSRAIKDGDAPRALGLLRAHSSLIRPSNEPGGGGRESPPSEFENSQSRFTPAAAIQEFKAPVRSGNSHSAPFVREKGIVQPASVRASRREGIAAVALPSPSLLKQSLRERVLDGFGGVLSARDPLVALQRLGRFRILCALRQGPYGVEALNRAAEEIFAEAQLIPPHERWYLGRPVMVTRNDYQLKLYNGDVGIVLPDAETGETRAWFLGLDNTLRGVSPMRLPEHETVFATTVHKSQGSEFEEVLFILPDRDSPVLTRELLYTGATRASRRMEVWFNEPEFRSALARRVERASGLSDALWGQSMVMTSPEN